MRFIIIRCVRLTISQAVVWRSSIRYQDLLGFVLFHEFHPIFALAMILHRVPLFSCYKISLNKFAIDTLQYLTAKMSLTTECMKNSAHISL